MSDPTLEPEAIPQPACRSFLLRCWQESGAGPGGALAWRFTLVEIGGTQARQGFTCLETVSAHLQAALARPNHLQEVEPANSAGTPRIKK